MAQFDVSIEDLSATELDELVDAIARHCGGRTLEAVTIRPA